MWAWLKLDLGSLLINATVGAAVLALISRIIQARFKSKFEAEVERLKALFAAEIEQLKATLEKESYVFQKSYDHELNLYTEIWPPIAELGTSIQSGEFTVYDKLMPANKERIDAASAELMKKLGATLEKLQPMRPFIPKQIAKDIDVIVSAATSKWTAWQYPALNSPKIFTPALTAEELTALIDKLEHEIRERTYSFKRN